MQTSLSKSQKSNSRKALFMTISLHVLFVGGLYLGTNSNNSSFLSSNTAISKTSTKKSTSKVKSKYYNAAKALNKKK